MNAPPECESALLDTIYTPLAPPATSTTSSTTVPSTTTTVPSALPATGAVPVSGSANYTG